MTNSAGRFLRLLGAPLHAAAGVERQHDGDRQHGFLEGVDLLRDAVLEDDDVLCASASSRSLSGADRA